MTFLLFRAQSPAELYWGNSTESMSVVGCQDFSEIVVSSSIRRVSVFIRFWFDFIQYFVLRSHVDSSQDLIQFNTSLFTCSMLDFHDAKDRQYFE
jgi:hypothetical protein